MTRPSVRDWKLYFTLEKSPLCTNLSAAAWRSSFPTCVPTWRPLAVATCGSEMDFSPSARISRTGAVAAAVAGGACARVETAKIAPSRNAVEVFRTDMCLVYRKKFLAACERCRLYIASLYGDGLCQIARLVYIAAPANRDVVGQELQRNNFEQRGEQLWSWRDLDNMVRRFTRQVVARGYHRDY